MHGPPSATDSSLDIMIGSAIVGVGNPFMCGQSDMSHMYQVKTSYLTPHLQVASRCNNDESSIIDLDHNVHATSSLFRHDADSSIDPFAEPRRTSDRSVRKSSNPFHHGSFG